MPLSLRLLPGTFTIHRFGAATPVPEPVMAQDFYSIARTPDELSIVCRSSLHLNSETSEPGWVCYQVMGPLDFSLTGILAGISAVLQDAGVSIYVLSTFDTDYILVKSDDHETAQRALQKNGGYRFVSPG